jgi:tetratricopeptide (TPR) repeat protein
LGSMIRIAVLLLVGSTLPAQNSPLDRAQKFYQQTDYQLALQVLEAKGATSADSLELAGRCHYMLGDFKQATEDLERASRVDAKRASVYLWLGRAWGRRAELSNPLMAPSYASKARQNFEMAVTLDPNNHEAANDLLQYYLEAPGFLGGGLDKASTLAEKMRGSDPVEANYALAQIAEHRKQFDLSERYLRKAVELAPRQVGRLVDLARVLGHHGKYQEMEAAFAQAEQIDPVNPGLLFERASIYIAAKRNIEKAKELLEKYMALPLTPEDPPRQEARKLLTQVSGG